MNLRFRAISFLVALSLSLAAGCSSSSTSGSSGTTSGGTADPAKMKTHPDPNAPIKS
jgi:hypothetical protein